MKDFSFLMHYSVHVASVILKFEKEITSKNDYLLSRIDTNCFKYIEFSLMSLETLLACKKHQFSDFL